MVTISRSTKPRPRHQPLVDALEERLALNAGAPTPPNVLPPPAAIEGIEGVETYSGTATPAAAEAFSINGSTDYTLVGGDPEKGQLFYSGEGESTVTLATPVEVARGQTFRTETRVVVIPTFTTDSNGNRTLTGFTCNATITATAANGKGDQLIVGEGEATFISPTEATGTLQITGGTGRFAHATGVLYFHDVFEPVPPGSHFITDHQTFSGTITIQPRSY